MKIRTYAHVLIVLGIFIIALAVYGVWYARVGKESAEAVSLADQIAVKTESRTRTKEAKDELERALADETAVRNYFVDTENVVPFLESLQETGSGFGADVEVESVSSKTGKPHGALELALRITGTFGAVERTLGAIEYQPYDTVISQLSLDTAADSGSSTPEWVATLTARVGTKVGGAVAETSTKAPPPSVPSTATSTTTTSPSNAASPSASSTSVTTSSTTAQ